jgi:hypothetical protein
LGAAKHIFFQKGVTTSKSLGSTELEQYGDSCTLRYIDFESEKRFLSEKNVLRLSLFVNVFASLSKSMMNVEASGQFIKFLVLVVN